MQSHFIALVIKCPMKQSSHFCHKILSKNVHHQCSAIMLQKACVKTTKPHRYLHSNNNNNSSSINNSKKDANIIFFPKVHPQQK